MNPLTKRIKMKNRKWATVLIPGGSQISVLMLKDETEEELKTRVENSIWGSPAKVVGIYSTSWGK